MKQLQILFFMFLCVNNCSSVFAQEDFDKLIISANEKASSGDFQGALNDYDKIINQFPNYSVVYFYRGNIKFRMNRLGEAIVDYDKAISMDSSKAEVYFYRAICKIELNDFTGAVKDLDHTIAKDPNFGDAYVKRGEVKIVKLNQKEEGCADIQKALDLGEEKAKISQEKLCQ